MPELLEEVDDRFECLAQLFPRSFQKRVSSSLQELN